MTQASRCIIPVMVFGRDERRRLAMERAYREIKCFTIWMFILDEALRNLGVIEMTMRATISHSLSNIIETDSVEFIYSNF